MNASVFLYSCGTKERGDCFVDFVNVVKLQVLNLFCFVECYMHLVL